MYHTNISYNFIDNEVRFLKKRDKEEHVSTFLERGFVVRIIYNYSNKRHPYSFFMFPHLSTGRKERSGCLVSSVTVPGDHKRLEVRDKPTEEQDGGGEAELCRGGRGQSLRDSRQTAERADHSHIQGADET